MLILNRTWYKNVSANTMSWYLLGIFSKSMRTLGFIPMLQSNKFHLALSSSIAAPKIRSSISISPRFNWMIFAYCYNITKKKKSNKRARKEERVRALGFMWKLICWMAYRLDRLVCVVSACISHEVNIWWQFSAMDSHVLSLLAKCHPISGKHR